MYCPPGICVLVHALAPPIGFADTYTDALPSTPTHSAADGQDVLRAPLGPATFADDHGPSAGSVDTLTSPNTLDATQNEADAHDTLIGSACNDG